AGPALGAGRPARRPAQLLVHTSDRSPVVAVSGGPRPAAPPERGPGRAVRGARAVLAVLVPGPARPGPRRDRAPRAAPAARPGPPRAGPARRPGLHRPPYAVLRRAGSAAPARPDAPIPREGHGPHRLRVVAPLR